MAIDKTSRPIIIFASIIAAIIILLLFIILVNQSDPDSTPSDLVFIDTDTDTDTDTELTLPVPHSGRSSRSQTEVNQSNPPPVTSSGRSSKSQTERWFLGGTLHKSNATEWKQATRKNRLATCGDFATQWYNKKGIQPTSMDQVKIKAEQLLNCIDGAIDDPSIKDEEITTVATYCIALMWGL